MPKVNGSTAVAAGTPVTVACMKWGKLYGPDYVNRLARGVARHLTYPHRFVCFTDDATGFDPGIEVRAIPVLHLPDGKVDTRWRKLGLFSAPLADLTGIVLFLDLDLVILDSLDPFFTHPGIVPIIRDMDLFRPNHLRRWFRPERQAFLDKVGNSSVFRFEAGGHDHVLTRFLADPDAAMAAFRISQQFQSDALQKTEGLSFWPKGWCVSFKNDCVPRGVQSYLRDPAPPPGTKIVVFAGTPKMTDVLEGGGHRWYRRIGKIDWLKRAWERSA